MLEGPIRWRMGWPRVGSGGALHTRAYDDVCFLFFNCSNTMVYVDRLHKLVAAQCACSDFRQRNALVLNLCARVSQKHDTKTNTLITPSGGKY